MAGGVLFREVVDRLDEASAHQLTPDAVDEALGKQPVAGVGDDGGEFGSQLAGPVAGLGDLEIPGVALGLVGHAQRVALLL